MINKVKIKDYNNLKTEIDHNYFQKFSYKFRKLLFDNFYIFSDFNIEFQKRLIY